ncbi:hypothetical protein GKC30_14370 [Pseudodesulfovibrio sp. F-1]|uniref:Uncharacterized protein n=1 Tax=Pseudodesulfovibrio alkaliphilus TaxID=2661613 RepID=A0A7K1KRX7_9BACT|nr:hypothetical protein [Pseudodesulfovibrio alkaliphilus]MUM78818.1 hypothetical protein [Pseudodesulfovibrio alkaliphilus]
MSKTISLAPSQNALRYAGKYNLDFSRPTVNPFFHFFKTNFGPTIQYRLRKNEPPGDPVGLPRAAKEVLGESPSEVKRFFSKNEAF